MNHAFLLDSKSQEKIGQNSTIQFSFVKALNGLQTYEPKEENLTF